MFAVEVVDIFKGVNAQQHELQGVETAFAQQRLHIFLHADFVEQSGDGIDFVLLPQIGNETGEKARFAIRVPFKSAAAAHPYPFTPAVAGAVFDTVIVGTAIHDNLVGFQKVGLVVGMNMRFPHGGGIFKNFARQAEFLNHGSGITERACFNIGNEEIGIRASGQGLIQHAGITGMAFIPRGCGNGGTTPGFFLSYILSSARAITSAAEILTPGDASATPKQKSTAQGSPSAGQRRFSSARISSMRSAAA